MILDAVRQIEAQFVSATEQVNDVAHVFGARDNSHFFNTGASHPHQRMIDHRVASDGQKVFVGDFCQGKEAAAGAAGQDYTFQGLGHWIGLRLVMRKGIKVGERVSA